MYSHLAVVGHNQVVGRASECKKKTQEQEPKNMAVHQLIKS